MKGELRVSVPKKTEQHRQSWKGVWCVWETKRRCLGSIMESERQSGAEEAGEVSRGCCIWSGRLYRAQPCSIIVKKN